MHGPPAAPTSRGMLLLAAVMLALAIWMSFGRNDWQVAPLWYALAGFFASYGALSGEMLPRWHMALLIAGLLCGLAALVFAIRLVRLFP